MQVHQQLWQLDSGWSAPAAVRSQLVLCFGERAILETPGRLEALYEQYPDAIVLACSAGGAIAGTRVLDDAIAATAVEFERSAVEVGCVELAAGIDEFEAGRLLGRQLPGAGLVHVLLFAPGMNLNAGQVLAGMKSWLPAATTVTGGLASDGAAFERTVLATGGRRGTATLARQVVAVGLYGPTLAVRFGSMGGWDTFGPTRAVTKSRGNVLFELDGQPALTLYKKYLGHHAAGLPGSGLLFPLSIQQGNGESVTRTLLNVDDAAGSITLAGDVPEGCAARLMRGNLERLIDGASAAAAATDASGADGQRLALLVSCIGRRLVLKQRIEEEIEAVRSVLGPDTALAGFYSNGELCPNRAGHPCSVQNQTMTVTTIEEA